MKQQQKAASLRNEFRTDNIIQIMDIDHRSLNLFLFARTYEVMPMVFYSENLQQKKMFEKAKEQFKVLDENIVCTQRYNSIEKDIRTEDWILRIGEEIWLTGYPNQAQLLYSPGADAEIVESAIHFMKGITHEEDGREEKMYLVTSTFADLEVGQFRIHVKPVDLATHYNDDFMPVSRQIIDRLSNTDSGIVLLHGLPGTGKTSYIRNLIRELKKKIIYLPVHLVYDLAGPRFISLLTDHPHSILVIEDAENVIAEREDEALASIANILNLSDGLLGDCLSVQIVCTFNCHLSKIDKALLRKGRLIAQYYFDKLTPEKSTKLLRHLGHDTTACESLTLAEIYNYNETNFANSLSERRSIGFAKAG